MRADDRHDPDDEPAPPPPRMRRYTDDDDWPDEAPKPRRTAWVLALLALGGFVLLVVVVGIFLFVARLPQRAREMEAVARTEARSAERTERVGAKVLAPMAAPGAAPERAPVAGIVDLQALAQTYRTNEADADAKYTGRRMTCAGFVHAVEKTDAGGSVVSFEYVVEGFNLAKTVVRAHFPASEADKLAKLEFGSPVRFTGRCDGWDKKEIPPFVAIRDCKVESRK